MCDYSLHIFPNRLAIEGENLVVHRFGGASLGLASPSDLPPAVAPAQCARGWSRIKEWFKAQRPQWETVKRAPAVCVPPGAQLVLRDIPKSLQRELAVEEVEIVRFTQLSADIRTYRDAVRFQNNRVVLLQSLHEGQRATVLSLGISDVGEPVLAQQRLAGVPS